MLDLGGGTGSILLAVPRRHAHFAGTLFELPTVTPAAERRLAEDPEGQRVEVVAGDVFADRLSPDHER